MYFVNRLKGKVQREKLWFFILILLTGNDMYGYELRRRIYSRFGFWSRNVTTYRVLYDLERLKLVRSERRDKRRYYLITGEGRKEVEATREFLRTLILTSNPTRVTVDRAH